MWRVSVHLMGKVVTHVTIESAPRHSYLVSAIRYVQYNKYILHVGVIVDVQALARRDPWFLLFESVILIQ